MAKISLREYNQYIEQLIKQDNLDEAIAHCKYILKIFPKHIDTYRLLGQSFLENQQHIEASDIFKRVLMVIPDDFLSHYGISIIYEDEGNLNAAIWHMERAFEVQPSNAAIQADLKRLFGRRDGVEPLKIRLSRGALIRMYVRGELYPQAISEIESGLSEDPQRVDLQVTLARLYKNLGRLDKVKDICATLLEKSSYCYEANKIMSEISSENEAVEYRTRLIEIDPYSGFLSEKIQATSQVPNQAVLLEKLEWFPEIANQPGWEESSQESRSTETSGWISGQEEPEEEKTQSIQFTSEPIESIKPEGAQELESIISSHGTEETRAKEAEIPDWMQTAGWEKTDHAPESEPEIEQPFEFMEEEEKTTGEAIAADDIPDWLRDAKLETYEESDEETKDIPVEDLVKSEEPEEKGVPLDVDLGWLESLAARQGADQETLITSAEERSETPPEWISDLQTTGEGEAEEEPADIFGETSIPESLEQNAKDISDIFAGDTTEVPASGYSDETIKLDRDTLAGWLTEEPSTTTIEPEESENEIAEENQLPDWLTESTPTEVTPTNEELPVESSASEVDEEELPDWLKEIEEVSEENIEPTSLINEKIQESTVPSFEEEVAEESNLPDWLKDYTEKEEEILEPTGIETIAFIEPQASGEIAERMEITEEPSSESQFEKTVEQALTEPDNPTEETPETPLFSPALKTEKEFGELTEEIPVPSEEEPQPISELSEQLINPEEIKEEPYPEAIVEVGGIPELIEDYLAEEEVKELESTRELSEVSEMVEEKLETIIPVDTEKYHEWKYEEQAPAKVPAQPTVPIDTAVLFNSARLEMSKNKVDEAVSIFNQLIVEHSDITQVIDEIKRATNSNPYHSNLWQSLGYAYAKNDQLQDALNAYTQAEILLR